MSFKKIIISHSLFQGYNEIVSINEFNSIQELSEYMKNKLVSHLITHNLSILVEKAQSMKLHHHNYKFISELANSTNDIIYLCSHCNNIF